MKCQVLFLLPGCDISNDSGLDFVKLFREEMAMRGWFLCAGSQVDDIVVFRCLSGDSVDEPLSEEDEWT